MYNSSTVTSEQTIENSFTRTHVYFKLNMQPTKQVVKISTQVCNTLIYCSDFRDYLYSIRHRGLVKLYTIG